MCLCMHQSPDGASCRSSATRWRLTYSHVAVVITEVSNVYIPMFSFSRQMAPVATIVRHQVALDIPSRRCSKFYFDWFFSFAHLHLSGFHDGFVVGHHVHGSSLQQNVCYEQVVPQVYPTTAAARRRNFSHRHGNQTFSFVCHLLIIMT